MKAAPAVRHGTAIGLEMPDMQDVGLDSYEVSAEREVDEPVINERSSIPY